MSSGGRVDDSECNDAREDGRDDSDSDLSADTEYNWLDHVRRDRAKINKILLGGTKRKNKKKRADGIPVFSYKGPVDELPPNVLIIGSGGGDDDEKHRSSIDVVRTSGGSSKNSQVLQRLTPFVTIPTIEHILGLSKIRKRLGRTQHQQPKAIVVMGVDEDDVNLIIQFYLTLSDPDRMKVNDVPKKVTEVKSDWKNAAHERLFNLATSLGAKIFVDAFYSPTQSISATQPPEADMTIDIVQDQGMHDQKIPYVVIPHFNPKTFKVDVYPTLIVDCDGDITTRVPSVRHTLTPRLKVSELTYGDDEINYMTATTFKNLTNLYRHVDDPTPKLIVFANICPSAVLGMIDFYDIILNPTRMEAGETDTLLYRDIEYLQNEAMKDVVLDWIRLAIVCGADTYKDALRRKIK